MALLSVRKISKRFGGVVALQHCSFSIERNSLTALIGPNGAGKTTLFDIITGLLPPDSGTITLHPPGSSALPLTSSPAYKIARHGVARTWQQVRLFNNLSMADHLLLAGNRDDHALFRHLFRPAFSLARSSAVQLATLQAHAAEFGIDRPVSTPVADLSFGQRKLLQLAMVFLRPHQLVLLDEPVAGVNPVIQQRIETLLIGLKANAETVVVIEHDMEFIRRLADEVIVLDHGRVLAEGAPGAVLSDASVISAYLGK